MSMSQSKVQIQKWVNDKAMACLPMAKQRPIRARAEALPDTITHAETH